MLLFTYIFPLLARSLASSRQRDRCILIDQITDMPISVTVIVNIELKTPFQFRRVPIIWSNLRVISDMRLRYQYDTKLNESVPVLFSVVLFLWCTIACLLGWVGVGWVGHT